MTPDWKAEIRLRWPVAAGRRGEGGMVTIELGINTALGPILIGVDQRGDHHLLVPVGDRRSVVEDTRAAHVRLTTTDLVIQGTKHLYIDVVCHNAALHDTFDDLLASMIGGIERKLDPASAIMQALDDWRQLLSRRAGLLGDLALRGLFGELVVLEKLARRGHTKQLQTLWTGPDRTTHDFAVGQSHLEVKTLGSVGSEVVIHGLNQLLAPVGATLYLVVVRLEGNASGRSLPEQIRAVERLVSDQRGLAVQLAKAGYSALDATSYEAQQFSVVSISTIEVDDAFPRLTPRSLLGDPPAEIVDVRYTLDIEERLLLAPSGQKAEDILCGGHQV